MIEIGILKNFDSETYKAGVQLAGSLTTYFDDVSVARNIPSLALVVGNYVILAIPGGNPRDACVIAAWPSGASPVASDPPVDQKQVLNIFYKPSTERLVVQYKG
jgi:hypothetical protein